MDTFAEVRDHVLKRHELIIDEPFLLGFECPVGDGGRKQSIFLAEIQSGDGKRFLRVETPVVPLDDFDAEKCLRINLMQRVGYLAVGDLDGTAYIKLCENLPYRSLEGAELDYVVDQVAPVADRFEEVLEGSSDIA
ncbi:MAG: hypothetical protein P8008_05585 [Gammaproteobacteria bacterium]